MSDARPIISVRNLSKGYNLYSRPRDMLLEALLGGVRHDVFWALKEVSFDVLEGERVGILGPNGAGKSTLLRVITGNLTATSGEVTVNGGVSAMLSLTSALNPNESGLENIRFNLFLSGVDKRDVPVLTDEIVEFAELGGFIHAPVRTYSTGMNGRLAFSIATAITPDVLMVDEVLGVGDAYFSAKAMLRMIDLCNDGRSLLFVSHSTAAIQLLCNKAIWLDGGSVRAIGPVEEIVRAYEDDFRREEDDRIRSGNIARNRRLRGKVRLEDIQVPGVLRFRLVGDSGRLTDTHYVRCIAVDRGEGPREISLYVDSIDRPETGGALDLVHSEWGRTHTRRGTQARTLASSSRLLRGGHILVRNPPSAAGGSTVRVVVESTSLERVETLTLELADLSSGEWIGVRRVATDRLGDGWLRTTFEAGVSSSTAAAPPGALERIVDESRPDIEVDEVAMVVAGEETTFVKERQPFSLRVGLTARRRVPYADVWVKITRKDGVYIFWQSTGQVGKNLTNVQGRCEVWFHFDPNIFGGAEYDVTIDIGNGYDIETNFPHTEVFDRQVNIFSFTVDREWKLYDTPPINYRFPVEVIGADTSETISGPAPGTHANATGRRQASVRF